MLFARLLHRLIRYGTLTVIDAYGVVHRFVGAPLDGVPPVAIRLHDRALHSRLFFNPNLSLGEAYMDGALTLEQGTVADLLMLCGENMNRLGGLPGIRLRDGWERLLRVAHQHNHVGRSRRNVAHHYDLSGELYGLFLDPDRQYSCAYFEDAANDGLEAAQTAKKRHIAAKLLLRPGQKVLDIGSGWGGLALSLARAENVDVTGITLSEEQLKVARARADDAQLRRRVHFDLCDYRQQTGRFDRIVSVGMFEHVGLPNYRRFFSKVRDLLTEDGVALLHSIGRSDGPGATNPWIGKYIFPGGYCPALSEVLPAVEKSGLIVTDIEILRLHYAETLKAWQQRFQASRDRVARLYDERFCRMWEFYLAGSEMAFRHQRQMVFQIQVAKRMDAVPLTRDYIAHWEHAHRL